jgi:hypothetical protein
MASNAGFSPRELDRRTFQQAVAETLDRQAQAIQQTREFVADLSARVDSLSQQMREGDEFIISTHTYVLRSGFLGRLRWLLTGK